ncbi:hypothetical protein D3C79_865540 [compost metagenome]
MQVNGVGSALGLPRCIHLPALQSVFPGVLPSRLRMRQPLQADMQPGRVHHHEHGGQATVRLPHQPAAGPLEAQRAGGAAANAQLVLKAIAVHGIALAILQPFRHQQQRQTTAARRCIR